MSAGQISCVALVKRVLIKGKVKIPEDKPKDRRSQRRSQQPSSKGSSVFSFRRSNARTRDFERGTSDRLSATTEDAVRDCELDGMRVRATSYCMHMCHAHSQRDTESDDSAQAMAATRIMEELRVRSSRNETDALYAGCVSVRSMPAKAVIDSGANPASLLMISINEGNLLKVMGLTTEERNQIEGLQVRRASSRAIVRLAANPPAEVGSMQRLSAMWLVRPYPNG